MCLGVCLYVCVHVCVRTRVSWAPWVRVLQARRAGPPRCRSARYLVPAHKDHAPVNCQLEAWTATAFGLVLLGSVCSREVVACAAGTHRGEGSGQQNSYGQQTRNCPFSRTHHVSVPRLCAGILARGHLRASCGPEPPSPARLLSPQAPRGWSPDKQLWPPCGQQLGRRVLLARAWGALASEHPQPMMMFQP